VTTRGLSAQSAVIGQLRWAWEVPLRELETSVFVIPAEFGGRSERSGVKNREDRVVVLNDVAKRVVEAQRGLHRQFVFVASKGKPRQPIRYINNTAWQKARKAAGPAVRGHDLKHTFGRRLRTAGVSLETRKVLLGHKTGGHHQSLLRPGTRRVDPKAERDPEDACIDVAALGGAAADEDGGWREKSRKSRAGRKRARSASPNPFVRSDT
jgi:integrase